MSSNRVELNRYSCNDSDYRVIIIFRKSFKQTSRRWNIKWKQTSKLIKWVTKRLLIKAQKNSDELSLAFSSSPSVLGVRILNNLRQNVSEIHAICGAASIVALPLIAMRCCFVACWNKLTLLISPNKAIGFYWVQRGTQPTPRQFLSSRPGTVLLFAGLSTWVYFS